MDSKQTSAYKMQGLTPMTWQDDGEDKQGCTNMDPFMVDSNAGERQKDEFKGYYDTSPGKVAYLEHAKKLPLNIATAEYFFEDRVVTHCFGIVSLMRMRIGFDQVNGVWKLFVKRNNPNCKSSILQILFAELEEILEYLTKLLEKIENGKKMGDPFLRPKDLTGWTFPKSVTVSFWQNEDVFYTGSGQFRIRPVWNYANTYEIVFNVPNDASSYDNFYGPKIRFGIREVVQFMEQAKKIMDKLPPWDQMN